MQEKKLTLGMTKKMPRGSTPVKGLVTKTAEQKIALLEDMKKQIKGDNNKEMSGSSQDFKFTVTFNVIKLEKIYPAGCHNRFKDALFSLYLSSTKEILFANEEPKQNMVKKIERTCSQVHLKEMGKNCSQITQMCRSLFVLQTL